MTTIYRLRPLYMYIHVYIALDIYSDYILYSSCRNHINIRYAWHHYKPYINICIVHKNIIFIYNIKYIGPIYVHVCKYIISTMSFGKSIGFLIPRPHRVVEPHIKSYPQWKQQTPWMIVVRIIIVVCTRPPVHRKRWVIRPDQWYGHPPLALGEGGLWRWVSPKT